MTSPIVDVDAFTDPLLTWDDGEDVDATKMLEVTQLIANRTRRLMNIARGAADVQTPVTLRLRCVGAEWLDAPKNPGAASNWEIGGNGEWDAIAAIVGTLRGSLNDLLLDGCTVTRVRCMVTPASARTGGDRMGLELRRTTYTLPAAPAVTPASDSTASLFAVFDDESSDQQMIDSGVISELIDKATTDLVLQVRSGLTGSTGDRVHMVEITFTDPGRRW